MIKTQKFAKTGALIGGASGLIYNLIKQFQRKNNDPNYQFDWESFFKDVLIGTVGGTAVGAGVGAVTDYRNAQQPKLNTTALLTIAASNVVMDKSTNHYKEVSSKANKITRILEQEFRPVMARPIFRIGSTLNGTALSDDFDIDLALEFRSGSFSSTKHMYDSVFHCLENKLYDNQLIEIRRQNKSLGVRFEGNSVEYKIDVVPVKLSNTSNPKNTSGYLHKQNRSLFENHSRTKTDIEALNNIQLTEVQKEVLVLLKHWRTSNDVPIGSHLLKSMIKDAYASNIGRLPRDKTKKLILILKYIHDNIHNRRLVSVENTNNVVSNIPISDKDAIYAACKKVISDYEYQPNSIIDHFYLR